MSEREKRQNAIDSRQWNQNHILLHRFRESGGRESDNTQGDVYDDDGMTILMMMTMITDDFGVDWAAAYDVHAKYGANAYEFILRRRITRFVRA